MKDIIIAVLEKIPPTQIALVAIVGGMVWVCGRLIAANLKLAREIEHLSTLLETIVYERRVVRRNETYQENTRKRSD